MSETKELLDLIIEGIRDRKGEKITIVDMGALEMTGTPRFVICEGKSTMHVASIADSVREYVQAKSSIKPYNYDGYKNSLWIVIDYGDIMVHLFHPDTRRLYNLEELWSDAKITDLPDEL